MKFANNPWLFVIVGCVIAIVIGQSVFFLIRALKQSKELGMDQNKIKKSIKTTAVFTIAPSFAIVVGMVALTKSLGLAIPWLRLSVAGSITYETTAADSAIKQLGLSGVGATLTPTQFVTVFLVMTTGIIIGLIIVPIIAEKYQNGLIKLENKDPKWSNILTNSLFIGLVSAFVGFVFCDVTRLFQANETGMVAIYKTVDDVEVFDEYVTTTSGLVPVLVFFTAALTTVLCALCMKKFKWKWMGEYALPISLIVGMASAIPYSLWLC